MPDIITILSSAGASVMLTAALIFLARNWVSERIKGAIQNEYDQKLETHKAQLKAVSDVSIEELKARLQVAASERNIRLTRVFEDTVETISGTYSRLLEFYDAVCDYTSIIEYANTPPKEERRKTVGEKYKELLGFYRPRRPFLPKAIVSRIEDLRNGLHKTAIEFMYGVEEGGDALAIKRGQDKDSWFAAHKFVTEQVPPLLELLDDDLRKILGTVEQ